MHSMIIVYSGSRSCFIAPNTWGSSHIMYVSESRIWIGSSSFFANNRYLESFKWLTNLPEEVTDSRL